MKVYYVTWFCSGAAYKKRKVFSSYKNAWDLVKDLNEAARTLDLSFLEKPKVTEMEAID